MDADRSDRWTVALTAGAHRAPWPRRAARRLVASGALAGLLAHAGREEAAASSHEDIKHGERCRVLLLLAILRQVRRQHQPVPQLARPDVLGGRCGRFDRPRAAALAGDGSGAAPRRAPLPGALSPGR